ncbi:MAG: hypothetical protein COA86_17495 [Kangiella sp.]|nr:MAG: hypothetical protein COA86_17495 [Kangiella sp.]
MEKITKILLVAWSSIMLFVGLLTSVQAFVGAGEAYSRTITSLSLSMLLVWVALFSFLMLTKEKKMASNN